MQAAQYGHKERGGGSKILPALILASIALFAYAIFAWASSRIGALYGYDEALGEPLVIGGSAGGSTGGFVSYSPAAVMRWPKEIWEQPAVSKIINQATMAFGLPLVLAVALAMAFARKPKATKDLHGTARWAEEKEIKTMGYLDGKGVYVGGWWDKRKKTQRYLRHNGPEHILCFAPTRSGKGVGLILPTLLSWPDSTVVIDIKGENWALTSGFLKSQGHTVLRFDPSDAERQSSRFNPLEEVRLSTGRAISDTQQLATMILDPDGKGLSDYWDKAAFGFFASVILHCMIVKLSETGEAASLYDVSIMLEDHKRLAERQNDAQEEKGEKSASGATALFQEMIKEDHAGRMRRLFLEIDADLAEAAHVFIAAGAAGMLAKAPKEMAGVVSTATANMSLYRDPIVARNTACCDFRITDLMNHETALNMYLVVSPADIDRTRPLFRIFVSQLCGRLMEKMEFAQGGTKATYKHRLLLMLDEFTSLGKLAILERAIAYMAGYGIKGYFIVQDTKQLNAAYGQDNALMANCHVRIAYAPNIIETAELLSKMTGTTTVVQYKKTLSKGGTSLSVSEVSRPLLTPDECMRLPGISRQKGRIIPGDMLIFTAGNYTIYGRQILHFLDEVFLARASIEAPKVADSLYFTPEHSPEPAKLEQAKSEPALSQESIGNAYLRYLDDFPEELQEAMA